MMFDLILKSTQNSGNLGLIARVAKNYSIGKIKLVNPLCSINKESFKFAPHSKEILINMEISNNLKKALKDYTIVFGTSARSGKLRDQNFISPFEAKKLVESKNATAAIIFGPEDKGLTNEDLALCNYIINIPTTSERTSLNLSHAVAIVAYEFYREKRSIKNQKLNEKEATFNEVEGFFNHLNPLLEKIGYFKTSNPLPLKVGFKRLMTRFNPSSMEIKMLRGILRQLDWYINKRG